MAHELAMHLLQREHNVFGVTDGVKIPIKGSRLPPRSNWTTLLTSEFATISIIGSRQMRLDPFSCRRANELLRETISAI